MSTNNSAKQDYERAIGDAHHDNEAIQEEGRPLPWCFYALLIVAIAMMTYGGVMFLLSQG